MPGFLLVAMGAACGSSQSGGASGATDGGGSTGGNTGDGAGQGDVQSPTDAMSSSSDDSGGTTDGEGTADSGSTTDGGKTGSTLALDLGTAAGFVVLAKSGISTAPASVITGDLGVSPAAATYITGFSLIADATNVFSTSPQVTGKVYASNYASPTPANLITAIGDMQLAFTNAAGRPAGVTNLGAGNIGGKTLTPGVYKWSTGLLIPTGVTLSGNVTDVWILQIAQDLTLSDGTQVALTGGAVPANVFWQVSGAVTLGTTAHMEGVVLSQTAIALQTGASINGRLLAQTAVTLEGSTVVEP
jgi:hypothetical protein